MTTPGNDSGKRLAAPNVPARVLTCVSRSSPPMIAPPAARDATDPSPGSPAARRRAARALGDAALVAALATGDVATWGEFDARFRPLLEAYARRVHIPAALWPQCVDEVLADEAMRLADGAPVPAHLGPYLVRASYHALLRARRAAARRERRYGAASLDAPDDAPSFGGPGGAERVVLALCSAAARRASHGPRAADGAPAAWDAPDDVGSDGASRVVAAAAAALAARLTDAERQLLVWVAEEVPRRQIAEWLGDGYEAVRKRVQRLARRLQGEARRYAASLPAAERHEFERFLRRAGHPDVGVGAARAAGAPPPIDRAAPPREDDP